MKIFLIKIILIIAVIISFQACSSPEEPAITSSVENEKPGATSISQLPEMQLTDMEGKTLSLNSFKGKKLFVNLWATWCPPCRAELPSIESLASKVGEDENAFVLLSLDENFDVAKKFAKDNNLTLPVYYPAQNLPPLFNVNGIPVTFIFDENGKLLKQNNGAEDYDTQEYIDLLTK